MEESLDAIMALLRGERVTMKTDGFILEDAHLQLSSYSQPHLEVAVAASFSPTGPRSAGKHGVGMISIAATARQGMDMLSHHYDVWDEIATENGHTVDRSSWRLVGPMHIAETREQAERDVEFGIEDFSKYFSHVLPGGPVSGDTVQEILENNRSSGFAVIGSPDDAIERIQELLDASNGGFGAFLFLDHNWANPAAKHRSYELFAQYVIPHFQGQISSPAERKAKY
jgi:limonene 1,2-monooxygenase